MGPFLGTLFRSFTHIAEMPQWFPALLPAESKRDSPMREIVGAMVRGPMKRMKRPMRPEKPTSTWKTDPTIMDPWSLRKHKNVDSQNLEFVTSSTILY